MYLLFDPGELPAINWGLEKGVDPNKAPWGDPTKIPTRDHVPEPINATRDQPGSKRKKGLTGNS